MRHKTIDKSPKTHYKPPKKFLCLNPPYVNKNVVSSTFLTYSYLFQSPTGTNKTFDFCYNICKK